MTTLVVSPMQWGSVSDLDDVEPLGQADYECLAEIRDVLSRHGKRERFGVALLHKHFDLEPDERMVEVTDKSQRVLTIRPAKDDGKASVVETVWMLQENGAGRAVLGCRQYCGNNVHGNHGSFHGQT